MNYNCLAYIINNNTEQTKQVFDLYYSLFSLHQDETLELFTFVESKHKNIYDQFDALNSIIKLEYSIPFEHISKKLYKTYKNKKNITEKQKNFYAIEGAEHILRKNLSRASLINILLRNTNIKLGGTIIEIGSADNVFLEYLMKNYNFDKAYGFDLYTESKKYYVDDKPVEIQQIDLNKELLPQHTNFADCIYCSQVLHHISQDAQKNVISYIQKALKPNGVFILRDTDVTNPVNEACFYCIETTYYIDDNVDVHTISEFIDSLCPVKNKVLNKLKKIKTIHQKNKPLFYLSAFKKQIRRKK